jgi:hypothetical protein
MLISQTGLLTQKTGQIRLTLDNSIVIGAEGMVIS